MLPDRLIQIVLLFACALCVNIVSTIGAVHASRINLAVIDFGDAEFSHRATLRVAEQIVKLSAQTSSANGPKIFVIDRDQSRAAARGFGYKGSLNLTLTEARDLGAAIGCDFYIIGDAQTLRRSSSAVPVYYESYASIFVVSTRTGRLILWDRPSFEAAKPEEAESSLLDELGRRIDTRYASAIIEAQKKEREHSRTEQRTSEIIEIDDSSEKNGLSVESNFRPPRPYRRLRPVYPDTAARAEAEATVDVSVEIGADGEVKKVEVIRWAGFGLDEAVISAVRQLYFWPAMRDKKPVPVRVMLRYNFRRPARK